MKVHQFNVYIIDSFKGVADFYHTSTGLRNGVIVLNDIIRYNEGNVIAIWDYFAIFKLPSS